MSVCHVISDSQSNHVMSFKRNMTGGFWEGIAVTESVHIWADGRVCDGSYVGIDRHSPALLVSYIAPIAYHTAGRRSSTLTSETPASTLAEGCGAGGDIVLN